MRLQAFLRWLCHFILPLLHWRVPVVLLRGTAQGSQREVVLLRAGRGESLITQRFFTGEPMVERSAHVPIWRLQRVLDEWQPAADLVAVTLDRFSSSRFLHPHQHLPLPSWIGSSMEVPESERAYKRSTHSSAYNDISHARGKEFSFQLSRDPADFDVFYERFYLPHIQARHGSRARAGSRRVLRFWFRRGAILWALQNGERVAGDLMAFAGTQLLGLVNGVLDGRYDLIKSGALRVLYVQSIEIARQHGCTSIHMGHSLPSLHDGVLRYKSKWATGICGARNITSANEITLLGWRRLEGAVAEFLSHTSLIYEEAGAHSALWVFPADEPLTAQSLTRHFKQLKIPGLRRFCILLPGPVPPDFVCPPKVCLISLADAEKAGAGGLTGLGGD